MLIQIDDSFRVTIDSSKQNLQLEKLTEIKDKKTSGTKKEWLILGYHGLSLRSVLLHYKNEALLDDKLETINNVVDKLNEIDNTIVRLVKNIKLETQND